MLYGFILYALGDILCFVISYPGLFSISKTTVLIVVLIGQFIKNAGAVPCVYIWMSLVADVLDHLEWKAKFRCDGITVSFTTIFTLFMPILGNAIINSILGNMGYVSPSSGATSQSLNLQIVFDFCAVGVEVITSIIIVVLMCFFNIEKNLSKEQEEIQERKKEEALASGLPYVSPSERERLDEEEFNKDTLKADLDNLQRKCEKKHLDYETEKIKYYNKKEKRK